jgi:hypothetical protein
MVMRTLWWASVLAVLLLLAGCAAGTYSGPQPTPSYQETAPGFLPPSSWYGNDPNMEKWFTPPYFNPHFP